jgi:hypothetical protein
LRQAQFAIILRLSLENRCCVFSAASDRSNDRFPRIGVETGAGFFVPMSQIHEPLRCRDGHLRSRVRKFEGNNELRVQAFVVQLGRLSTSQLEAICCLKMCNKRRAAERLLKFRQSQTVTGSLPKADASRERNMPRPSKPSCASPSADASPPFTPPPRTDGFCEDNPR